MNLNIRPGPIQFFLLTMLAACPLSAQCQGQVLSLETALEIALNANLSVMNAELVIDSTADDVAAIKTRRLPKLELGASYRDNLKPQDYLFEQGIWGTYPVIGPVPSEDVSISSLNDHVTMFSASLSQPLSQQYKISLGIKQSEVKQDMADQNLRMTRTQLAREVKRNYFQILQFESDLTTINESIQFYHSLQDLVSEYVEQKIALTYQLLEVEARLAQREARAVVADNELATLKQNMNYLLNRDLNMPFTVAELPESTMQPMPMNQALDEALVNKPELAESRLRIKSAQLGYDITKAGYIPDVNLRVSYARLYGSEFIPDTEAYVGVRARWEFYDWGRRSYELASKETDILRARNQLKETEESTRINVEKSYKSIASSRQIVEAQRLSEAAALDKLRVLKNQYEQQVVLLQDVLDAETELSRARTGYTRAVLGVWSAQADLQRALGEI
jgi:outer membrane protein